MSRCSYCNYELPGDETLCRSCFDARYFTVNQPKSTVAQRVARFARVAPVSCALITVNVTVFAAFVLATGSLLEPTQQELIRWGADYGPLTTSGQWWRLLTSTFLHGGVIHLIFNMQCLRLLGPIAERAFGRPAFLLGYLGTALCASLASQFSHPNEVCIGASGAIFGIAGLLVTPIAFKRLSLSAKQLANPLKSLLAFAGFNLVFGAIVPGIDNAAHLGGFVSGLIVGIVFALRHRTVDMETEAVPKDITEQPASS